MISIESIATIISAILGMAAVSWGGYAVAKHQVMKKVKQAIELLSTAKNALEDNSLSKEEIKEIMERAKALITFKKGNEDA